jgi:hypothetical protein
VVTVKVYVEGGGDHNKALETQCRRGFSEFFRRAGLEHRMPRVVRCGGRRQAYEKFRISHEGASPDDFAILLVDSEAPVAGSGAWNMSGYVRATGGYAPRELRRTRST